ncbi:hypothetical protein F503_02000 [Ophiostoma piceae UAMH 11346]|uniref:Uncharacterized protein n=1 Tax=Ophiostoma piceae (strain UAMH 11346) TaxID=1262450 RepID=S3BS76_OPHP1|nr:hypothetical protein F503_02000 [Ophiostoma piceae UAMH 11346]
MAVDAGCCCSDASAAVTVHPSLVDAVDRFTFRCHDGQGGIRDNEGQLARAPTADTRQGHYAGIPPHLDIGPAVHDARIMGPTQADIKIWEAASRQGTGDEANGHFTGQIDGEE